MYDYISEIDNNDKFKYLAMILVSIFLMRRLALDSHVLVGLLFGIILVYYLNQRAVSIGTDFVSSSQQKLRNPIFREAKNLHQDSELLDFLYSIREYRYYNPAVYRKLILIVDRFLRIVNDMEIGVADMGANYEQLKDYKSRALNGLHSMIYRIPQSQATNRKFESAMDRLEVLMNVHLDNCYQYMVYAYGKQPININTKFIYKNQPSGVDKDFLKNYQFHV